MSSWSTAHQAWSLARENTTYGYETEEREFAEDNPQPTLKQFMIGLAFKHLKDDEGAA